MRQGNLINYMLYDNEMHTITMDSCRCIANTDYIDISEERDEIYRMSCLGLEERYDFEKLYHNRENRAIAEFRISTCDLIRGWKLHKKQP